MDILQLIALIVVALIVLAVIIAYRGKLKVALKFLGLDLDVEAENEPAPTQKTEEPPAAPPAGVRARNLKSEKGILIEEGTAHDSAGTGIDAEGLEAGDDILIGKGESGDPKVGPPA